MNESHSKDRESDKHYFLPSYGDIAPKSTKGRLAAILWILFGLVTCSLFVAIVSSILTMACLSNESSLRDSKVY